MRYETIQCLTNHGGFEEYRYRFKRTESPICHYCSEIVNAEHIIFKCIKCEQERQNAKLKLTTTLQLEDVVHHMLESKEKWNIIAKMIVLIMTTKADKERKKQN